MIKRIVFIVLVLCFDLVFSQKVELENFKGEWTLSKEIEVENSEINFYEFLYIDKNSLAFYDSLKMNFQELNANFIQHLRIRLNDRNIKFIELQNGEIWELRFREINNQKRIIWKQLKDSLGYGRLQTDHRNIIRDSQKRKQALEGEINTFYTKIE